MTFFLLCIKKTLAEDVREQGAEKDSLDLDSTKERTDNTAERALNLFLTTIICG